MARGNDLGKWGHGNSNEVECLSECGILDSNLSDAAAIRLARRHIADHPGHFIEQTRCLTRFIDAVETPGAPEKGETA